MRYTSLKGILLQVLLISGAVVIVLSPVLISSAWGLGWRSNDVMGMVIFACLHIMILFPIIRGAILKRKIADYPKRRKGKSILLWFVSYVVVLIVLFVTAGVFYEVISSIDFEQIMGVPFFATIIVLSSLIVAIADYRLITYDPTNPDSRLRKKWDGSKNRHIQFYSPAGLVVQVAYLSLLIALIGLGFRIWFDDYGENIIAAEVAFALWAVAIILLFVRDKILYRFYADYPKRSFARMIIAVAGFLGILIVIFGIYIINLEEFTTMSIYQRDFVLRSLAVQFVVQIILRDYFLLKSASKKKTFTCPYCFVKNLVWSVHFRCTNKVCVDVPDIEQTRYEHGDEDNPIRDKKTFPAKFKRLAFRMLPKRGKCRDCSGKTSQIICSTCHNDLPASSLLGKDIIISIVGSQGAGKSHFLGVLLHELKVRVAGSFNGTLVGFSDSKTRYEKRFYRKLYVEKSTLEPTESFLSDKSRGTFKPLIFELQGKNKKSKRAFVFYETAGIDLENLDIMSTEHKFISRSAGIIFLLDPLQFTAVAHKLDDRVISSAMGPSVAKRHLISRADEILGRVSTLIRNDNNISSSQKIDIPTAAVLTKLDAIEPILPSGLTLSTQSPHCSNKGFLLSDRESVNSETQNLLTNWGEGSFMAQLDVNYDKHSYFAVSALGSNNSPREDKKIDQTMPHRIEDPLLWLMKENNIIKPV